MELVVKNLRLKQLMIIFTDKESLDTIFKIQDYKDYNIGNTCLVVIYCQQEIECRKIFNLFWSHV